MPVRFIVVASLLASVFAVLVPEGAAAESADRVTVEKSYDGRPFEYTIESVDEKPAFTIYRLAYPSPVETPVEANNTVPAEYYLPHGIEPGDPARPAVVCLHILNGNYELVRMVSTALADRGVPALWFKLPYYGERSLPGGHDALARRPDLFVESLRQGIADVRRAVDLLASRPEVDGGKVGVVGISLGGILAATAAANEDRIHRTGLILAGGDVQAIIDSAHEARDLADVIDAFTADEKEQIRLGIHGVDPLTHAAKLRERAAAGRVLMINAAKDEVVPRACTEKLAAALGITDRVIWLEGLGHYTAMAELPRVLGTTVDFFAQDLPPGVEPPAPAVAERESPVQTVVTLLTQASQMLTLEPKPGRGHFVELEFTATPAGDKPIEGRFRYVRGSGNRFVLSCDLPGIAAATLGQGEYPWMLSGGKAVFCGTGGEPAGSDDPLQFADADHLVKLRVAGGAAAGLALAPAVLDQWVTLADGTRPDGPRAIRITLKEKDQGEVRLELAGDGRTPRAATFDVEGVRGKVTFRGWQTGTVAHDALFEPPSDVPQKEVGREELYRVFSAMFNFAMESAK